MSESLGLTKQQAKNLMKFISDNISMPVLGAGGGFAPIGTLNYYMGTVAPQGWLICDGTVYNIADYPEFATFIASNYGSTNAFGGDGVTTFAVPDCRGEFARMIGTNSHANQGNGGDVGEHQNGTQVPYMRIDKENTYFSIGVNEESGYDIPLNGEKGIITRKRYIPNGTWTSDTGFDSYSSRAIRPTNTSWNFIVKATVSGDANGHVYSTDEQIVGTWTDGSILYERTMSTTIGASGTIVTLQPNSTIANIRKYDAIVTYPADGKKTTVLPFGMDAYGVTCWVAHGHTLGIRTKYADVVGGTIEVTFLYTKTQS